MIDLTRATSHYIMDNVEDYEERKKLYKQKKEQDLEILREAIKQLEDEFSAMKAMFKIANKVNKKLNVKQIPIGVLLFHKYDVIDPKIDHLKHKIGDVKLGFYHHHSILPLEEDYMPELYDEVYHC